MEVIVVNILYCVVQKALEMDGERSLDKCRDAVQGSLRVLVSHAGRAVLFCVMIGIQTVKARFMKLQLETG